MTARRDPNQLSEDLKMYRGLRHVNDFYVSLSGNDKSDLPYFRQLFVDGRRDRAGKRVYYVPQNVVRNNIFAFSKLGHVSMTIIDDGCPGLLLFHNIIVGDGQPVFALLPDSPAPALGMTAPDFRDIGPRCKPGAEQR